MRPPKLLATSVLLVACCVPLNVAQAHDLAGDCATLPQHASAEANPAAITAGATLSTCAGETVTVAANEPIPNLPGKRLVSLIVDYDPGASSAAHRHADSAFIYAFVLSGAIRSKVDDDQVQIYKPGDAWFEKPGAHHGVSANASTTEPARLLAVFIIDASDQKQLVTPDPK